jgi:hypothetical protein
MTLIDYDLKCVTVDDTRDLETIPVKPVRTHMMLGAV